MPDAILADYDRRITPQGLHVVSETLRPLVAKAASLREGPSIPPRQWLYGSSILRQYVTVLVAPGGVGKTAWSIGAGMSLALGKGLIGDDVHARVNVLFCSLEDPEDEFDRRIAAAMQRYEVEAKHLTDRIWNINGRDRRLVIAALDTDGLTVCYPDKDAMIDLIREHNIGVVFVDPFINSHELEENSNPHINAAARAWAEIANETESAIVLVHHTRKGAVAGDIDSGRGASALIGACRVGLTLSVMSPDDAKSFGLSERERRLHVRLDDAKANLAPPANKARWLRLASIPLGNCTRDYPNGDNVQAIEEWEPPSVWRDHTPEQLNEVLDAIAEGPAPGSRYAPHQRGRTGRRWAGRVVMDMLDVNDQQAKQIVGQWLKTGLLFEEEYRDPSTRKMVQGVSVDDEKRPTI